MGSWDRGQSSPYGVRLQDVIPTAGQGDRMVHAQPSAPHYLSNTSLGAQCPHL